MATSANPFRRGSRGWGMLIQQNHATGGANGSIMVGSLCACVLLAKSLPSGSFLFVPERT
jgi:hypothetical protein